MISLIKSSVRDMRSSYKKYLLLELVYILVSSFVLIPVFAFIFNRIFRGVDSGFLINSDIYRIGLSVKGLAGILFICLLSIVALFIEFGIILLISQKTHFGKEILISEALVTVVAKVPKLFGFGLALVIFFLLLLAPLIDSPLIHSLLESVNAPAFIQRKLYSSDVFLMVYTGIFLLVAYILLRCIFTLHFIIIRGQSTAKAIRSSFSLTKHVGIKRMAGIFLMDAAMVFAGLLFTWSLASIPDFLGLDVKGYVLKSYLIAFSSYLTFVFVLLLTPIHIILITKLFYQYHPAEGAFPEDSVSVFRCGFFSRVEIKISRFFTGRRPLLWLFLILYITGTFILNYSFSREIITLRWNVLVIGHRGDLNNAPENSLSSIRSAINKGVDAVEMDVQMTKDGIVVLHHDVTLKRVAGVPYRVADLTYEELLDIDLGYKNPGQYKGEKIPRLEEALEEIRGNAFAVIEIKPYGSVEALAGKVVEIIDQYGMTEDCYIQSFDPEVLKRIRQINTEIKIGQILYLASGNLSSLDVDFYTIEYSMLSDRFIENAHKDGRKVWVWTINSERSIREVLKYDIDGIITDVPERVKKLIQIISNV